MTPLTVNKTKNYVHLQIVIIKQVPFLTRYFPVRHINKKSEVEIVQMLDSKFKDAVQLKYNFVAQTRSKMTRDFIFRVLHLPDLHTSFSGLYLHTKT